MSQVAAHFRWPDLRVGQTLDGSTIEASGTMHALVYFGKGDYRVVPDRPIVCTAHDLLAKVVIVHRCGTDVKIFQSGRPDQAEESLLVELGALIGCDEPGDSRRFLDYVRLLESGQPVADFADPLYRALADAVAEMDDAERQALWAQLHHFWGRIFGHETVVEIVRIGSRVHELTAGIGYRQGETLSPQELGFAVGRRYCLQSRIAHYHPPAATSAGVRGIQLLGGNITDLAMNQAGAFAQYVRIRPEVICSGSVLHVPESIDSISGALVEPLACLLDCFHKSTHEIGQDDRGSILKRGVMPGGLTLIIGSGSMAAMAGKLALMDDPVIEVGGTREVLFIVRSQEKRDLILKLMNDPRVSCLVVDEDRQIPSTVASHYLPHTPDPYGRAFAGFDDVILAAGGAQTVAVAHELLAPTGSRLLTFAGTRGPCEVESGVWHYKNAGVLGTSGCNTKMMEIALGILSRRSLDLTPLSGRSWTFADLQEKGTAGFFEDRWLRPKLLPSEGLPGSGSL
ncbi:MAG: hypothetical protein K8T25_03195 [Planctomycetia bacterium]|nr:hypothetical protein [Planctomycetia bacterium]